MTDTVLIIDFGSQVTQLIARRVRESGVYSAVVPVHDAATALAESRPKAVILSGGPASVTSVDTPSVPAEVFASGVPVLGICYGQQTMVAQLGGTVTAAHSAEFGRAELEVTSGCALFEGVWAPGERHQVWMSHGDTVTALPPGFRAVGTSGGAPFAVIADDERRYYGVQFHPEVVHTPDGAALLRTFTHTHRRVLRRLEHGPLPQRRGRPAAGRDRRRPGDLRGLGRGRFLCGGGAAARGRGEQLTCILVDNGLLRAGEADQVTQLFRDSFNIPLVLSDKESLFLKRLEGVVDPEQKRKIIGTTFIEVFEAEATALGGPEFLAQGTLYPDVIESTSFAGGPSATIKSHHNVGGLPEKMNLKLVEPLRALFKDEVRALGRELGLPAAFVGRHPFPGPGLAIRIPGAVSAEKLSILRQADAVYLEEIRAPGLYDDIWQAFAVLLPVRTVGVMGDERSYDFVCALRAVTSTDGMTAEAYPFTPAFLDGVARRIVNEVAGINRVVYDVTSKPPGTIEWE